MTRRERTALILAAVLLAICLAGISSSFVYQHHYQEQIRDCRVIR